jgi:hypothetical protein
MFLQSHLNCDRSLSCMFADSYPWGFTFINKQITFLTYIWQCCASYAWPRVPARSQSTVWAVSSRTTHNLQNLRNYTGRFIMFSVITYIYNKKTKGPTLMEWSQAQKNWKLFFLTARDVRRVLHGWHGTHRYDTLLGTDHYRSEEYRCTHVDACVSRTWILHRCVPYHPWGTHRTSLV